MPGQLPGRQFTGMHGQRGPGGQLRDAKESVRHRLGAAMAATSRRRLPDPVCPDGH